MNEPIIVHFKELISSDGSILMVVLSLSIVGLLLARSNIRDLKKKRD